MRTFTQTKVLAGSPAGDEPEKISTTFSRTPARTNFLPPITLRRQFLGFSFKFSTITKMRLELNLKTPMRAGLLLLCMVFASLYLLPWVAANAYTLEGARWSGQPSPGACCAQITYRNLAGDAKDFNSGTQGAAAWNNSSALVWFSTTSAADINFEEANNSGVSWDGLTSWTTYTGGDGRTYFSPGMTVQVNNYYLRNYTAAKAQSVSAHEFGHALGLGHNSACVLMNPYTSTRYGPSCGYINVPGTDDVSGADSLY